MQLEIHARHRAACFTTMLHAVSRKEGHILKTTCKDHCFSDLNRPFQNDTGCDFTVKPQNGKCRSMSGYHVMKTSSHFMSRSLRQQENIWQVQGDWMLCLRGTGGGGVSSAWTGGGGRGCGMRDEKIMRYSDAMLRAREKKGEKKWSQRISNTLMWLCLYNTITKKEKWHNFSFTTNTKGDKR